MAPKKIAVLLHEGDTWFDSAKYLVRLLMKEWEGSGFTVEVIRGPRRFVPADLIIPHLDLTVIPDEYCEFLDRYPVAINRRAVDISKSKISANILGKGDTYAGPVIVKTNRNFGGLPERLLKGPAPPAPRTQRGIIGRLVSKFRRKAARPIPWKSVEYIQSHDYPVFSSMQEVPPGVFENDNLVVEKFLPEVQEGHYCVRYYYFFGDKEMSILLRSQEQVIKGANAVRCEKVPVPPELHSIRRRMGFDYGKFDYVLRDGQAVLFDANRTPSYSTLAMNDLTLKAACHLAEGIRSVLG